MEYFSFESLEVFKKTRKLVRTVYGITDRFPKSEQYALAQQLQRAVVSIASNIAEGSGRFSLKEKIHFIEIAYGSLMEVYCQLLLAYDLGYMDDTVLAECQELTLDISRPLTGLKKYFETQLRQSKI